MTILLIFISLITSCNLKNLSSIEKNISECPLTDNRIEKFYSWFFSCAKTLSSYYLTRQNGNISRCFDNALFLLHKSKKSVVLRNLLLKINKESEDRLVTLLENSNYHFERIYNEGKDNDESEIQLRLNSDFNKGFFVYSTSVLAVMDYFKWLEKKRKYWHRDVAIIFLSGADCENSSTDKEVYVLLETAWKYQGLFNILVETECSDKKRWFFVYRPFHLNSDGVYGKLQKYDLDTVLASPKIVLNSMRNFNRYPIRVHIFNRYPTAIESYPNAHWWIKMCLNVLTFSNISGVDGCSLGQLAERLNFQTIVTNTNCRKRTFGYIFSNGSSTGSLGDVINRKVDIAMNGVFLEYRYALYNIEFSLVMHSYKICAVVPKAKKIPEWACLLKMFSAGTWICVISFEVGLRLFWTFLSVRTKVEKNFYSEVFRKIPIDLGKRNSCRILAAAYLFTFHVILEGIFAGSLFKSFSTVSYYPDINSLEDLDESNLPIETSLNIFGLDENESKLMKSLSDKVRPNDDTLEPVMARSAHERNVVAMERQEEAILKINSRYLGTDGAPLLHVVPDCPMTQFISHIVPEGSPYLLIFNHWFSRLQASGFITRWTELPYSSDRNKTLKVEPNPRLTWEKLELAFFIWKLGLVISALVFFTEVLSFRKA
ncbi:hypothetical protein HHI36_020379 [Cryptolaemus montrouzieri]|uniref:Ionotropic receptor n=1 Tax=Cryptolaemus montrouzieri TaxID=559131 RepID=A0ABD2NAC8_9CUCU